jgi:hypothetical protein
LEAKVANPSSLIISGMRGQDGVRRSEEIREGGGREGGGGAREGTREEREERGRSKEEEGVRY